MRKLRSLYILETTTFPMIYGPREREDIASRVEMIAPQQTKQSIIQSPELLSSVEAIFSGWGAPLMDEDFLDLAPELKVVFYGAGAVSGWMTECVWERDIIVTSAYSANAVPVSEYTLATILLSLKHFWHLSHQTRSKQDFVPRDGAPGCYGSKVGLVSMGAIAHKVVKLLKHFDLQVFAYDPFTTPAEAHELGITMMSLPELFATCDVVSVHTPDLKETEGLITGQLIDSMKLGATFINTSRGQVVCEHEMIDALTRRPDLHAVLDVTHPEPPHTGSPLYNMPNVVLTPHIAGSVGHECQRMGRYMVEELDRHLAGEPLKWQITRELALHSSHRPIRSGKRSASRSPVSV